MNYWDIDTDTATSVHTRVNIDTDTATSVHTRVNIFLKYVSQKKCFITQTFFRVVQAVKSDMYTYYLKTKYIYCLTVY